MSEFTVKIMRPGRFGALTAAKMEMPATWAEFHDTMQKARVKDNRVIFSTNLLRAKLDCLRPHIPAHTNPYELNFLAQRLNIFDECKRRNFVALVRNEENGTAIPMSRLIDLTFSIEYGVMIDGTKRVCFFERTGAPVVLSLSKITGDGAAVTLDLPAYGEKIKMAVNFIGASSLDECRYQCADCLIPTAKGWIENADSFEQIAEFADSLYRLERTIADIERYKAMLEVVGCDNLTDAIKIADDVSAYELLPEMASAADYGNGAVDRIYTSEGRDLLYKHLNMESFGQELMQLDHAVMTSYGVLRRTDRSLIQAPEQEHSGHGMHM